jgi:hypothetical protein
MTSHDSGMVDCVAVSFDDEEEEEEVGCLDACEFLFFGFRNVFGLVAHVGVFYCENRIS